jgi:2-polyprenyl-3-methyl-5-hydroxy-6-metoxy-1,4-benzoquinol methylase
MDPPTSELAKEVEQMRWFHAIDFGGYASSGRFPQGQPQNITLFGAMEALLATDLRGHSVLDVGCADGLMSFGAKRLGAEHVVAIDSHDKETFRLARRLTGETVDYRPGIQIKDATSVLGVGQFDVVLCAGVIYHMLNPASAFIEARKLVKLGGVLIMESAIDVGHEGEAAMVLNSEAEVPLKEPFTYWLPTEKAMVGLMKLVGFDVIATRRLISPARTTVVGRAAQVDQIRDRSEMLIRMHERDFVDFELRHSLLPTSATNLEVSIHPVHREIRADEEHPSFPYHSHQGGLGSTQWRSEKGNY